MGDRGKKLVGGVIIASVLLACFIIIFGKLVGCSPERSATAPNPSCEGANASSDACQGGSAGDGGGAGADGGGSADAGTTGGGGDAGAGGKKACASVVTFDEVKPILALNCASCHSGIDTFDRAKKKWPEINTNVQANAAVHMPPGKQLGADHLAKIASWKADGFLNVDECDGGTTTGGGGGPARPIAVTFQQIETAMFTDLSTVNVNDQPNTRWLLYTDRINAGAPVEELATYKKAAAKSTASVSPERELYPPQLVAPGILRIDIDELGISPAQWNLLEQASQLQLESNTSTGKALKQLTKTRLPWLLVSEFQDLAMRNSAIYYNLTRSPATLQQLLAKLGVDFNNDLKQGKAALMAFNGSRLSPAANRLMARFDADETGGAFWLTEDTGPIVNQNQSIFVKPGIAGGGTVGNLQFAAGEMIYTMENGMQGFFLADNQGRRLNQADPNVVHDFTSNPNSPIIIDAISCTRCHNGGYLTATDAVRASITGASSQVNPADAQLLLALYKPQNRASAPAGYKGDVLDELFAADNAKNTAVLQRLGIDPADPDPISEVGDRFRGDLVLADVAGFFGQTAATFQATCLNVSQDVRAQIGQLANGSTASFAQLVQVVATIKKDCRVFEDPIN